MGFSVEWRGKRQSTVAAERGAFGWRGSRSGECGRSPWEAGEVGSDGETHRSIEPSVSADCGRRSRASERRLGRWPRRRGDGWRWRRDGYSGRDTAAHTRVHQRVAWSKRSSLCGTGDGARPCKPWAGQAGQALRPGAIGRARRPTSGWRRTCRETRAVVRRWEGRSVGGIESNGRDRGRVRRRGRHSEHGDEVGVSDSRYGAHSDNRSFSGGVCRLSRSQISLTLDVRRING